MKKRSIIIGITTLGLIALTSMNARKKEAYSEEKISINLPQIPSFYALEKRDSFQEIEFIKKELEKKASYKVEDFNQDQTEVILARMLWGETGGCSELEKIAVAYTAINRTEKSKGKATLKEIILKPYQYSCFNEGTKSREFLKNPMEYDKKDFLENIDLSKKILSGEYKDPTDGATHYYNPDLVKTPKWAKQLKNLGKIGHHIFFKE